MLLLVEVRLEVLIPGSGPLGPSQENMRGPISVHRVVVYLLCGFLRKFHLLVLQIDRVLHIQTKQTEFTIGARVRDSAMTDATLTKGNCCRQRRKLLRFPRLRVPSIRPVPLVYDTH